MTEIPNSVLGSTSLVRADEEAEEDGEGARSGFATKERGQGDKPAGRQPCDREELWPDDWPAESRFGSQVLGLLV